MPRLDLERDLREQYTPLPLSAKCANPFCPCKVMCRGDFCAVCFASIERERELLRLKKEAKG